MAEEKKVEETKVKEAKAKAKPAEVKKAKPEIKAVETKKVEAKPKAEARPKAAPKPEVKKKAKKPSYKVERSSEAKKLGRARHRLEKKKGKFKRPNVGFKKKVPDRWRRPVGIDSRQQNQCKDKPPLPKAGYTTAKQVRGLHPTGYASVRVMNTAGLEAVDKKTQAIIIASSVGKRKRTEIQDKAKQMGIQILNFKE